MDLHQRCQTPLVQVHQRCQTPVVHFCHKISTHLLTVLTTGAILGS